MNTIKKYVPLLSKLGGAASRNNSARVTQNGKTAGLKQCPLLENCRFEKNCLNTYRWHFALETRRLSKFHELLFSLYFLLFYLFFLELNCSLFSS